jgi:GntR family transcriptional regulator
MEIMYEWQRVVLLIEADIESGKLPAGARLLSEEAMAQEYGCSVGTARRAVRDLRERGLVVTLPGKGTYVTQ